MKRNARVTSASGAMKTFGAGFVTGVASLTSFGHSAPVRRYPHESTSAALRGDWLRVGGDMDKVIRREHACFEEKKK